MTTRDKKKIVTFFLWPGMSEALDDGDLDLIYRKYHYAVDHSCVALTEFLVSEIYSGNLYDVLDNVSHIYESMFIDFTSPITSLKLPDNIKYVDDLAFAYSKFASIELPTSLTKIGMRAFGCTSLKEIYIPKGVERIEGQLFWGCESLERIFCEPKSRPEEWDYFWAEGYEDKVLWGATPENVKLYRNLLS